MHAMAFVWFLHKIFGSSKNMAASPPSRAIPELREGKCTEMARLAACLGFVPRDL
jgi:hypothetical protein